MFRYRRLVGKKRVKSWAEDRDFLFAVNFSVCRDVLILTFTHCAVNVYTLCCLVIPISAESDGPSQLRLKLGAASAVWISKTGFGKNRVSHWHLAKWFWKVIRLRATRSLSWYVSLHLWENIFGLGDICVCLETVQMVWLSFGWSCNLLKVMLNDFQSRFTLMLTP